VAHAPFAQAPPRLHTDEVGLSPARLGSLTEALHQYVEDGELPGGVMLVARKGEVAYLEAFGLRDRESRDPMREDSLFRFASQTKAIVVYLTQVIPAGELDDHARIRAMLYAALE
jgi:CubicO group peptidase (beta-lactamase class C family)